MNNELNFEIVNTAHHELLLLQLACGYEAGQRKSETSCLVIVAPQTNLIIFDILPTDKSQSYRITWSSSFPSGDANGFCFD